MTQPSPQGLTPEQAARRVGVTVQTIWRWIREGRLRATPVLPEPRGPSGRRYRVPREAVEEVRRSRG